LDDVPRNVWVFTEAVPIPRMLWISFHNVPRDVWVPSKIHPMPWLCIFHKKSEPFLTPIALGLFKHEVVGEVFHRRGNVTGVCMGVHFNIKSNLFMNGLLSYLIICID
jgi:hypothetical protein